jgi:hypothetical protein
MISYTIIITALISIESGGFVKAHNISEDAVGILQIRPIMVKEVNRILKMQGVDCTYTDNDRWNPMASRRMCTIFLRHQYDRYVAKYGRKPTMRELAMSWNSGSIFKKCTEDYKRKVEERLGE